MTRILHRVLGAAAVAGAAALASAAPAAADGPLPLVGLLAPDHDHGSGGGDAPNATVAGNASTSVIGGTTAG
ncbi:hypothetical protein ABZ135_00090 [Streptomyces sp. NPDC006339]|uniref:hypothetical protein n=1 Tax=Streptomyces sp. NPDC006339 TaxID=3156755 RepID=UPI0033B592C6